MKSIRTVLFLLLLTFCLHEAGAQRILVVQNTGRFKSFKYFVGDEISLKVKDSRKRISGTLEGMTDSSLLIDLDKEIMLSDIRKILRHRYLLALTSRATRIAGAGYLALDVTNNLITGNPTIFYTRTLLTSAGIVAFSYAIVPLHYRRLNVEKRWKMMVLDMDLDLSVPNPFQR